jgi:hypothetical protein
MWLRFIFLQILIASSFQTYLKECKPRMWGLPDPFQIELHPPSPPIPSSRQSSASVSPHLTSPPLKIALITAGSIRSFTFVEKSWKKYLLSNSKLFQHSLYLFAHLIVLPHCLISTKGLSLMKSLCTDIEISYSTQLYRHHNEVDHSADLENLTKSFPLKYQNSEFLEQFLTPKRGNFIDMYNRRHRAYQLSQLYRHRHGIQYDLVIFLRPDIAFYSPILNLSMFHHSLITWKESSSSNDFPPRRPIYVPEACNFYGVCDRIAMGLPNEMEIYFQKDFVLDVMRWSLLPVPNTSSLYCPKKSCLSMSEDVLECWFLMNNLTQIFYSHPTPLTFITLRSLYAMEYCTSSRQRYVTEIPTPYFAETDSDKYMARVEMSREYDEDDEIASVTERCGERFVNVNLSRWCDEEIYRCSCGDRNTWGIA